MALKPEYVLTRDYLDNNRINLHHYLCVEFFGYHTHPDIPTADPNLKVADVGTGTGIWLTDLAKRLPQTVQLDALDISFEATPPAEWLPSNIRTLVWDIKTDPPEDLIGVYDIVHIRHFTLVLIEEELENVLTRLLKLLKPGGYLQWVEVDMSSFRILKTNPNNQSEALETLFKLSQGQDKRLSPTYVPSLSSRFEAAGFENIKSESRDAPPHLALAMHECNLLISEILARKSKNEKVMELVKGLLPRVESETRNGACWAFTRWSVVGRKPQ
ncbi:S-adenosyl-L-methionine-dependent methyltransferase [Aspergillus pseudotamarii]|uniref:S-adenosyl-L-methionine-dependent methyltransferase n=1 Tax=Aspergillus pseudotamarii TaxID=132259 RepID=A0A5N6TBY9_ASPPS|nr:S-adenosyl-L-methionine-dependent methyltransferase [Aspergillus pseudotamarii]KAE8143894.1 S-adenosyl-L-methionine-dependent methyltransferase [Aspergillus pseudotamarii]